jgi:hypothetical protein
MGTRKRPGSQAKLGKSELLSTIAVPLVNASQHKGRECYTLRPFFTPNLPGAKTAQPNDRFNDPVTGFGAPLQHQKSDSHQWQPN